MYSIESQIIVCGTVGQNECTCYSWTIWFLDEFKSITPGDQHTSAAHLLYFTNPEDLTIFR